MAYLSGREVDRDIVVVAAEIGRFFAWAARRYRVHYLTGETDQRLQQFRDEVLGTTTADFHALADVLAAVKDAGDVVVLGSREAVEESGLGLAVTKVM